MEGIDTASKYINVSNMYKSFIHQNENLKLEQLLKLKKDYKELKQLIQIVVHGVLEAKLGEFFQLTLINQNKKIFKDENNIIFFKQALKQAFGIEIQKFDTVQKNDIILKVSLHPNDLMKLLNERKKGNEEKEEERKANCKLIIKGNVFFCHRWVLKEGSSFFQDQLGQATGAGYAYPNEFSDSKIDCKKVNVEHALDFIYFNDTSYFSSLSKESILQLVVFARKFQIKNFEYKLEKFLIGNISKENVEEMSKIAEHNNLSALMISCMHFLETKEPNLLKKPVFFLQLAEDPKKALSFIKAEKKATEKHKDIKITEQQCIKLSECFLLYIKNHSNDYIKKIVSLMKNSSSFKELVIESLENEATSLKGDIVGLFMDLTLVRVLHPSFIEEEKTFYRNRSESMSTDTETDSFSNFDDLDPQTLNDDNNATWMLLDHSCIDNFDAINTVLRNNISLFIKQQEDSFFKTPLLQEFLDYIKGNDFTEKLTNELNGALPVILNLKKVKNK